MSDTRSFSNSGQEESCCSLIDFATNAACALAFDSEILSAVRKTLTTLISRSGAEFDNLIISGVYDSLKVTATSEDAALADSRALVGLTVHFPANSLAVWNLVSRLMKHCYSFSTLIASRVGFTSYGAKNFQMVSGTAPVP